MRKAVIATSVGGNRELVIHNKTGLLVSPYQEPEMRRAMLALIKNPALRDRLAKAGHSLVKKEADHETIIKSHLAVYTPLIQ